MDHQNSVELSLEEIEKSLNRMVSLLVKVVNVLTPVDYLWDVAFDANQLMDMKQEGWKVDRVQFNPETGILLYIMKKEH
jgi:hypothetical protein